MEDLSSQLSIHMLLSETSVSVSLVLTVCHSLCVHAGPQKHPCVDVHILVVVMYVSSCRVSTSAYSLVLCVRRQREPAEFFITFSACCSSRLFPCFCVFVHSCVKSAGGSQMQRQTERCRKRENVEAEMFCVCVCGERR